MKNIFDVKRFRNEMRSKPTPAERAFKLRLTLAGMGFKTQMILGFFILDFMIWEKMLVIELDGNSHDSAKQQEYNRRRDAFISKCGFTVVRLRNEASKTWDLENIATLPDHPLHVFRSGLGKANAARSKAIIELRKRGVEL